MTETELAKYVRTHNLTQIRELLEAAEVVMSPLSRKLLRELSK